MEDQEKNKRDTLKYSWDCTEWTRSANKESRPREQANRADQEIRLREQAKKTSVAP